METAQTFDNYIGHAVALPSGLVAVIEATAGINLLLSFPGKSLSFLHPASTVRYLGPSYVPLIEEPDYDQLIARRNMNGALHLAGKLKKVTRGRKPKTVGVKKVRVPKEKTLQQLILQCKSPEEVKALLASRGM